MGRGEGSLGGEGDHTEGNVWREKNIAFTSMPFFFEFKEK